MSIEPVWRSFYEDDVPHEIQPANRLLKDDLSATADRFPNHTALHLILKYLPLGLTVEAKVTYRELDLDSSRLANALIDLGLKRGDRVAIMLPNTPQQVISLFGISKAGCIVVNANPIYTASELEHQFRDSNTKAVICMSGSLEKIRGLQANTEIEHILITDINDSVTGLFHKLSSRPLRDLGHMTDVVYGDGVYSFQQLLAQHNAAEPVTASQPSPDDPAIMQYTGGTTALPKAAVLTHNSLLTNVSMTRAWLPQAKDGGEVTLGALPFFHIFGLSIAILLGVRLAARIVITPNPRDTEQNMKLIAKEGVTIFPGVPAIYNAIIHHEAMQSYDMTSVRYCISGGAPLPQQVQEEFNRISGASLVEGYGLTECSPVVAANPLLGKVKNGTIGVPFPSTEIRIVSTEPNEEGEFEDVEPGAEGELLVRGPQNMLEYWNRPEETAETLDPNGWIHTGDIVTQDEEGYLTIVDRKKDLIIVSGFNVVPREVEEVLYKHPAVLEAAVAGFPDEQRGEIVKAYIATHPGQTLTVDEVKEFCAESLAPYKVPREVAFRDELPKSMVGKVLRRILVEEDLGQS